MPEKHVHIISFDIPYPANYGGVIDVFYKIKTLHQLGVKVHLHCIEYPGRERTGELNKYCEEVHYYPRKTGIWYALSYRPYIVSSRRSEQMMQNLLKDNYPIIFEGMHSCFYLDDPRLSNRIKVYRESNIEHRYYFNLFKVDWNPKNKIYFLFASFKLRAYQKVLRHADLMLAVSEDDADYLARHFKTNRVVHLPSFHANSQVSVQNGKGSYALYHGNIEVPENEYAAIFLINQVFDGINIPLVVAGMKPRKKIRKMAEERNNVELIANPGDEKLFDLIRNAHVNVLVTFQATGLKLKLLNTLYNGRFCLVNDAMIKGTTLGPLCEIGNSAKELREKIKTLFSMEFGPEQIHLRNKILKENYDNITNGRRLIDLVF
jgi:hypothetical protein